MDYLVAVDSEVVGSVVLDFVAVVGNHYFEFDNCYSAVADIHYFVVGSYLVVDSYCFEAVGNRYFVVVDNYCSVVVFVYYHCQETKRYPLLFL